MPGISADLARLHKRIDKFGDELNGKAARDRLARVGRVLVKDVEDAVRETPADRGSLGDRSMSGWTRRSPIKIGARATVHGAKDVLITPGRGAGPLRVLESGREAHGVGEGLLRFRQTKTKGIRVSRRIVGAKSGRAIGATKGKGTWTKASREMARHGASRMRLELSSSFRKTFGG